MVYVLRTDVRGGLRWPDGSIILCRPMVVARVIRFVAEAMYDRKAMKTEEIGHYRGGHDCGDPPGYSKEARHA